jgi:hypothetical protein
MLISSRCGSTIRPGRSTVSNLFSRFCTRPQQFQRQQTDQGWITTHDWHRGVRERDLQPLRQHHHAWLYCQQPVQQVLQNTSRNQA